jgi:hypothetical protein
MGAKPRLALSTDPAENKAVGCKQELGCSVLGFRFGHHARVVALAIHLIVLEFARFEFDATF